jgi:hypothetical protein
VQAYVYFWFATSLVLLAVYAWLSQKYYIGTLAGRRERYRPFDPLQLMRAYRDRSRAVLRHQEDSTRERQRRTMWAVFGLFGVNALLGASFWQAALGWFAG